MPDRERIKMLNDSQERFLKLEFLRKKPNYFGNKAKASDQTGEP